MDTVVRKRFTIAPAVVLVACAMAVALLALAVVGWVSTADENKARNTRTCEMNLVQFGDSLDRAELLCDR